MSNELSQADIDKLLGDVIVERIEEMEAHMLQCEQVDVPVISNNINGMYTREILIKKDTAIVGRVHLFDYVDIMLSGDISIRTPQGLQRYTGPNVFFGPAGRKRAGWAHEDTRWITVHRTDICDGDEFLNALTVKSLSDYKGFNLVIDSRLDYLDMIDDLDLTQEDVDQKVKNETDLTDFIEPGRVEVKDSDIDGLGLFAAINFGESEMICTGCVNGLRTIAGRYTNHSTQPNAKFINNAGVIELNSLRDIISGEEITTNYRDTLRMMENYTCQL